METSPRLSYLRRLTGADYQAICTMPPVPIAVFAQRDVDPVDTRFELT